MTDEQESARLAQLEAKVDKLHRVVVEMFQAIAPLVLAGLSAEHGQVWDEALGQLERLVDSADLYQEYLNS